MERGSRTEHVRIYRTTVVKSSKNSKHYYFLNRFCIFWLHKRVEFAEVERILCNFLIITWMWFFERKKDKFKVYAIKKNYSNFNILFDNHERKNQFHSSFTVKIESHVNFIFKCQPETLRKLRWLKVLSQSPYF